MDQAGATAMDTETIDHGTLSRLIEAGAVKDAHIVGQNGGWTITVNYGIFWRALASQRSRQVRVFRKFETLVNYLLGIGIAKFDVDAVNYTPEGLAIAKRPDRSEALRRAHQAVAHDAWFRDQVTAAQVEADDPLTEWVSNDEAKRESAAWRNSILAKAGKGN